MRDLYHYTWKVRIPKKSPSGDKLWQTLKTMSIQPEGESINEFLEYEKKEMINKTHLWVPVCSNNFILLHT